MKFTATLLLLLLGCHAMPKPCNVERIGRDYRPDVLAMLTNYPAATMEMLRTITQLEQEAGGYQ